jgi:hypothetical protein
MSFFRFVVLVLLVVWVMRMLRNWQFRLDRRDWPQPSSQGEPEVLRACTGCGVLVPARSLNAAGRCGRCVESGR